MRCSECGGCNVDVKVVTIDTEFKGREIGYCNNEVCGFTSWVENFE